MTIFLVRHAKAGSRSAWSGPDEQRPVSKPGRRQALGITEALIEAGVTRIVTSPYVRCRQTVEPLAERLGLPVDLSDALAEGAPLADALALVEKYADEQTVLCSHGDVIGGLVDHSMSIGASVDGDGLEKGSTWIIEIEAGAITNARYVPPPA